MNAWMHKDVSSLHSTLPVSIIITRNVIGMADKKYRQNIDIDLLSMQVVLFFDSPEIDSWLDHLNAIP